MRLAFLDRDGVINEDQEYVFQIKKFSLRPGIIEFCCRLKQMGFLLAVVTNQSGIGRGYYSLKQHDILTHHMNEIFASFNLKISYFAFCPHHPNDLCDCRKPKPKLINEILDKSKISFRNCIMVGDKYTDILAAKRAGIRCRFKVSTTKKNKNGITFEEQLNNIYDLINVELK